MALPDISDIVPELICVGVDVAICGILYKIYSLNNASIQQIKKAPVIDLESVKGSVGHYVKSNGHLDPDDPNELSVPYVIVHGTVSPLKSPSSLLESHFQHGVKGVIREFSIVEHKRTLGRSGFWYDSTRNIQTYSNHVPFTLNKLVEITDYSQAAELDLDVTYDKFDPAPNNLGDHVWGWVVGDRQKGVQSTEKMLINGSDLTAIGELVLNTKDGKVRMQAPANANPYYLVKETSKSLVKRLESSSRVLKVCLLTLGSMGLAIGAYAGWKYYRKWKIMQSASRTRETLRNIVQERRAPEPDLLEGQSCVVCLGQHREVILLECGHVCVCADCATEIMRTHPQCPVCRSPIDRVAAAYIS